MLLAHPLTDPALRQENERVRRALLGVSATFDRPLNLLVMPGMVSLFAGEGFFALQLEPGDERATRNNNKAARQAYEREDADMAASPNAATSRAAQRAEPDFAQSVEMIDATHYRIRLRPLKEFFAAPNALADQGRFVPAVKDGRAHGYMIYAIQPGRLLSLLGMKNGDKLTAISGQPIGDRDRFATALQSGLGLANIGTTTYTIERRGEVLTLTFEIVP